MQKQVRVIIDRAQNKHWSQVGLGHFSYKNNGDEWKPKGRGKSER